MEATLTHGHSATALAKTFNFVQYGVKDLESGEIDFDELRQLAIKFKPKIILAGFSSYTKTLEWEKFVTIGNEVGAMLMADVSHIAGLIAGGVLENPLDSGFHVLTTTTHKTLRGPRGGLILSKGKVGNPIKKNLAGVGKFANTHRQVCLPRNSRWTADADNRC
jgi:glycine hydroxymethyltransferase